MLSLNFEKKVMFNLKVERGRIEREHVQTWN